MTTLLHPSYLTQSEVLFDFQVDADLFFEFSPTQDPLLVTLAPAVAFVPSILPHLIAAGFEIDSGMLLVPPEQGEADRFVLSPSAFEDLAVRTVFSCLVPKGIVSVRKKKIFDTLKHLANGTPS